MSRDGITILIFPACDHLNKPDQSVKSLSVDNFLLDRTPVGGGII